MTGKITWLKADDIAARDDIPFNSRDTVYKAARANAIPHWNPGGMAKKSTLFPLEIILQWLAGEQIGDHWMIGRLATDRPAA